jgi:hypothetical protein
MDPRYPEAVFSCQFEYLEEFHYVIQGEYHNGGDSIHLPSFLHSHPTLKRLKLRLSLSHHRQVSFLTPDIALSLPQVQLLDAPAGYFACNLAGLSQIQSIVVKYPLFEPKFGSAHARTLETIWTNNTLPRSLRNITVKKTWDINNVGVLFKIAENFSNIFSVNLQGHYWTVCHVKKKNTKIKSETA